MERKLRANTIHIFIKKRKLFHTVVYFSKIEYLFGIAFAFHKKYDFGFFVNCDNEHLF